MRAIRILIASAMLIVGVLALNVAGAQAFTPPVVCAFSGGGGSVTADPGQPGNPTGVQAIVPDVQNGGILDTDAGSYLFAGSAECVINAAPAGSSQIASTGRYVNIVCGTGTMDGTMTITDPDGPDATGVTYHIDLIAWQGVMRITGGTYAGSPVTGDGVVSLAPSGGNCVTTDVGGFTISGGFDFG